MVRKPEGKTAQELGILFKAGSLGAWRDATLLDRFLAGQDASAEAAFATLVERHGPMVMRVCHARLGDEHEAHDAFQAVFLVLARKARSVRVCDSLGPWLYGVAWRVASRARAAEVKRQRHERRAAELAPRWVDPGVTDNDIEAVLHEEIRRLPSGFREAVVLCDLEGLTTDQAAEQLGAPVGTVRSRLSRGRDRLRGQLVRRGLGAAAIGVALSAKPASAVAVSVALAASTVQVVTVCRHAGVLPARLAWLVIGGRVAVALKAVAASGVTLGLLAWAIGLPSLASNERPERRAEVGPRGRAADRPADDAKPLENARPVAVQTDRERLQGTWRVIRATQHGRDLEGPSVLHAPMTFEGDTVEFGPFGNPPVKNRYRFRVDSEGEPRALRVVREGAAPRWWLYELRGDRLRTAAWYSLDDATRPTGFGDSAPGRELMVLELVREPDAAIAATPDLQTFAQGSTSPPPGGPGPPAPAAQRPSRPRAIGD